MTIRAKLQCISVKNSYNGTTVTEKTGENITFEARYSESKEDNSWSKWTPFANYSMHVTNPDIFGKFEENKQYYFDITPVNE